MGDNDENINKAREKIRILIVPLDWGLGHATRCIPIIYALIHAGAYVFLAGENNTEAILKKEFPLLPFLPLKGYNIRYSKNKKSFLLKLLSQLPAIKNTIQHEQKWLKKVVKEHKIDAVISDNRFGLYHAVIPTVYITHQLHIETGSTLLNKFAQQMHYHYINRFTECWVPDAAGEKNLAGKLSHPTQPPAVTIKYIGILSRFKKQEPEIKTKLLVILSGPEPQRSIFEKIILDQLKKIEAPVIFVRGLPAQKEILAVQKNIEMYNHMPANELSMHIQQAAMVLARAGYSTVMDLATLQQKAILVPTPGQAEQEYLAVCLKQQQLFYTCNQDNFNLKKALTEAEEFYKKEIVPPETLNEDFIINWLKEIEKRRSVLNF